MDNFLGDGEGTITKSPKKEIFTFVFVANDVKLIFVTQFLNQHKIANIRSLEYLVRNGDFLYYANIEVIDVRILSI